MGHEHTLPGTFLGWKLKFGGKWAGSYWVRPFGENSKVVEVSKIIVPDGDFVFPFKKQYEENIDNGVKPEDNFVPETPEIQREAIQMEPLPPPQEESRPR